MPTIPDVHEFVSPGRVAPDHPPRDRCMVCGASRGTHYYRAVEAADADVRDALSHVRAEEDAHRITTLEAAQERITLLENHLERCRQLRLQHLGGPAVTAVLSVTAAATAVVGAGAWLRWALVPFMTGFHLGRFYGRASSRHGAVAAARVLLHAMDVGDDEGQQ